MESNLAKGTLFPKMETVYQKDKGSYLHINLVLLRRVTYEIDTRLKLCYLKVKDLIK